MKVRPDNTEATRLGGWTIRPAPAVAARQGDGRPAFTLIETIVAVAAVALIAVGLASIFDAVGKTVKGGKRVSLLNQYSALIENQMRKDFSRMTREGFLLIRHEWADKDANGRFDPGDDAIALHPEDQSPRPRRIDQLLLFAEGQFETARQPVDPAVRVTSDTAMIYYGHGQKRRPDPGPYLQPRLDDDNDNALESRLGRIPAGEPVSANPNFYPAEWTLVRQATLLVKPSSSGLNRVSQTLRFDDDELDPAEDAGRFRLQDYEYQVGLQPAARSVFRSLNRHYPRTQSGGLPEQEFRLRTRAERARLSSGIVDIASTDLREVKAYAGGVLLDPIDALQRLRPDTFADGMANATEPDRLFAPWRWEPMYEAAAAQPDDLDVIHMWMQDAFPTQGPAGPAFGASAGGATAVDPWGVRIRVEPSPVALLSSLGSSNLEPSLDRLDKTMLGGNGFLPRCSEFIVEWSYGLVDPRSNRTIWYGPEARYDSDGDGAVTAADAFASRTYPYNAWNQVGGPDESLPLVIEVPRLPYRVEDPCVPASLSVVPQMIDSVWPHRITSKLIYGRDRTGYPTPQQMERMVATTAHFGYADPTFKQDRLRWVPPRQDNDFVGYFLPTQPDPDVAGVDAGDGNVDFGRQVDNNCSGRIDLNATPAEIFPGEPGVASLPWAWPKLIRVTITVSDAQDPSIENTFQFIFGVPSEQPLKIRS
jgi:hypothetical protein